jgi:hypothetical protein
MDEQISHTNGCHHPNIEPKTASFEDIYERIIYDAKTIGSAPQVQLDSPEMIRRVRTYVRSLLNGTTPMDEVLASSYVHKNGFQKIVLGRKNGYAVRFHRYIPGVGDQNIHDHRWSRMDSLVLEGGLSADYLCYAESTDERAERWQRHIYTKTDDGEGYIVEHQGETYLKLDQHTLHPTGCLYSMNARRLHRILPAGESVATLVVTHPVPLNRVWCNLYQKHIIEELGPVHEVRLSRSQMATALTLLERLLTRQLVCEAKKDTAQGAWA